MTYIIIVNWNGWKDTLECLESVFRLQGAPFRAIVCDNGSEDGSLEQIERWAQGQCPAPTASPRMAEFSTPPAKKPIPFLKLAREQSLNYRTRVDTPLVLIDCEDNLGFAGGNNIGLRFALRQPDMSWAWILNNDTVADPGALAALIDKMTRRPDAGMAGSTVVYYHQPDRAQAFGGARYYPWLGMARHIGRFRNYRRRVDEREIEKQMSYVIGASALVSRAFLEKVGLMSEDYFLYYEELDWALRAQGSFSMAYARESLVFHKAGASIGSSSKSSRRSLLSDYYLMSNRLKISQKFFPSHLLSVRLFLCLESLQRLLQGRRKHAAMIWRIATGRQTQPPAAGHA